MNAPSKDPPLGGASLSGAGLRRGAARRPPSMLMHFLRSPLRTGAVKSSSRRLGQAIAAALAAIDDGVGTVVELGGGSGAVSEQLLKTGLNPRRLVIIEQAPHLYRWLKRRYAPEVRVLLGDATRVDSLLRRAGINDCCAMVSSLPLSFMSRRAVHRCLVQVFAAMDEGGVLLQWRYFIGLPKGVFGGGAPVPAALLERLSLAAQPCSIIWGDFPSIQLWALRRRARDVSRQPAG